MPARRIDDGELQAYDYDQIRVCLHDIANRLKVGDAIVVVAGEERGEDRLEISGYHFGPDQFLLYVANDLFERTVLCGERPVRAHGAVAARLRLEEHDAEADGEGE